MAKEHQSDDRMADQVLQGNEEPGEVRSAFQLKVTLPALQD
jgi:hypothetical protein